MEFGQSVCQDIVSARDPLDPELNGPFMTELKYTLHHILNDFLSAPRKPHIVHSQVVSEQSDYCKGDILQQGPQDLSMAISSR